jgi:glycosyltransferase involved in cell wall biosynthesis
VEDDLQLSVVIPAYQEATRLPLTIERILAHLSEQSIRFEILAVDDGSTDRTAELVEALAARDGRVRLIRLPHRGKGAAVRVGALAAAGRQIAFCDADLSHSVEDITRLPALLNGAQVVIASREGEGSRRVDEPFYRHLLGRAFNLIVRLVAVPGVQDTQCGLKCFTRQVAQELFSRQRVEGFGFDVELLFLARKRGYRVLEVPVTWRHVPASRVDPVRDTPLMLRDVLRVRLNDLLGRYD